MKLSLAVVPLLVLAAACSVTEAPASFEGPTSSRAAARDDDDVAGHDVDDADPAPEAPKRDTPTDTSGVTPIVPGAKGITTWRGRVEATAQTDFGGGPWCDYHVKITNIDVQLALDADGKVVSSDLSSTMNESATACDRGDGLSVQQNAYSFRAPKDEADALTVLLPDPKNLPQANVALTLAPPDGARMRARLVFQRTDGADAALDWRVITELELRSTSGNAVVR